MRRVWWFFGVLGLVSAMVWAGTLWRWQNQGVSPDGQMLALYLVAVPLAVTTALLLGAWQVKKVRVFASSPLSTAPAAASVAEKPLGSSSKPGTWGWEVLAVVTHSRMTQQWLAAQQAIAKGALPPQLHTRIVTGKGQPALTAELKDLDLSAALASWQACSKMLPSDGSDDMASLAAPPADVLRVLALLHKTFKSLERPLASQWLALSPTSSRNDSVESPPPRVLIELGIPFRWSSLWRGAVSVWAGEQLKELIQRGLRTAGAAPRSETSQPAIRLDVHVIEQSTSWAERLSQRAERWIGNGTPGLVVMVCADSLVTQPIVTQMIAEGVLMTGSHFSGRLPGEAAAAWILATPAWLALPNCPSDSPLAKLAAFQQREVQGKPRTTGELLRQAADSVLDVHQVPTAAVKSLTCDTDHRPVKQEELLQFAQSRFPDLDTQQDILCVGQGCGDVGVAGWLLSAVYAVEAVRATGGASLLVSNFDELQRSCLLVLEGHGPPQVNDEAAAR